MTVVSNTSPILNLAVVGKVAPLKELFGQLSVPGAVAEEVRRLGNSEERFVTALIPPFVTVLPAHNEQFCALLRLELDPGEAEAVALAFEQRATLLLVDELPARVVAARLGLATIGCLGILLQAKRRGLIPSVRPVMEALESQAGFWIGSALEARVLSDARE